MRPALNSNLSSSNRLKSFNLRLGTQSTLELIKEKGKLLNEQFLTAKSASFHSKYVIGMKLGEGQHASVSICYERAVPRSTEECTPLLSH